MLVDYLVLSIYYFMKSSIVIFTSVLSKKDIINKILETG